MTPTPTVDASDPRLFAALVEQMPDALVATDRDGAIRVWNRAAETVFGFAATEAVGQSLDLIIPEHMREAHWRGFAAAMDAGRTRQGSEVRTTRSLHKDGRRLYVDISFGLLTDAAGAVVGAVAVARDGSARFAADKALRERLAGLEGQPR